MPPPIRLFVLGQPARAFYLSLLLFAGIVAITEVRREIPAPRGLIAGGVGALPFEERDDADDALTGAESSESEEQQGNDDAGDLAALTGANPTLNITPPAPPQPSWLEYRIRRGDTMESVLRAIRADEEMRRYLIQQKMKTYRYLRRGAVVFFRQNDSGAVSEILYKTSPEYYFSAGRDERGELWAREAPPVTSASRHERAGMIDSSLYAAAAAAGIDDKTTDTLVRVLETQIDFYRDVRKGDSFRVIYETHQDEHGEVIGDGSIIAFEYDSKLKARPRVIRGAYYDTGAHSGFYTEKGESLQRAFLPAPLKYRRISSRFSKSRFHPVLKRWRAHRGVDYAARSGTPVHSTADGVVSKVSRQRGYGNVVFISHFNNVYTTVYAHLRAFRKGIKRGKKVKQGEVIGYVGQTGLATGPHLHYEFRIRGKHQNPLSAKLPKQLPPLKGDALAAFQQHSAPIFRALDNLAHGGDGGDGEGGGGEQSDIKKAAALR